MKKYDIAAYIWPAYTGEMCIRDSIYSFHRLRLLFSRVGYAKNFQFTVV